MFRYSDFGYYDFSGNCFPSFRNSRFRFCGAMRVRRSFPRLNFSARVSCRRASMPFSFLSCTRATRRRRRCEFPRLISESSGASARVATPRQIRAIIRRGFMADTSRNNKEYPVSLPFLSNKSGRSSRVYLSSTARCYVTSPLTLKRISARSAEAPYSRLNRI